MGAGVFQGRQHRLGVRAAGPEADHERGRRLQQLGPGEPAAVDRCAPEVRGQPAGERERVRVVAAERHGERAPVVAARADALAGSRPLTMISCPALVHWAPRAPAMFPAPRIPIRMSLLHVLVHVGETLERPDTHHPVPYGGRVVPRRLPGQARVRPAGQHLDLGRSLVEPIGALGAWAFEHAEEVMAAQDRAGAPT